MATISRPHRSAWYPQIQEMYDSRTTLSLTSYRGSEQVRALAPRKAQVGPKFIRRLPLRRRAELPDDGRREPVPESPSIRMTCLTYASSLDTFDGAANRLWFPSMIIMEDQSRMSRFSNTALLALDRNPSTRCSRGGFLRGDMGFHTPNRLLGLQPLTTPSSSRCSLTMSLVQIPDLVVCIGSNGPLRLGWNGSK